MIDLSVIILNELSKFGHFFPMKTISLCDSELKADM
jgi:hypothetical protein